MKRGLFPAWLAALGVPLVLGACTAEPDAPAPSPAAAAAAERPPNIVFFLVDDMGWRDVGVFGSTFYETPHIDALAERGVRFTNAYAATHVCSPTRASLLTGKYPARLRLTDWLPGRREHAFERLLSAEKLAALPLDEVTLAEALREHDYSTAIFGKWHLGGDEAGPLHQGFDVQAPDFPGSTPRGGYFPPYLMAGLVVEGEEDEYLTDRLTDFAVDFIEQSQDRPFFLYLSHFAVHDPIEGRPDLVLKYREKAARMGPPAGPAFLLEGNPDDPEPLSRAQLNALLEQPSHQEHSVLPQDTVKIKQHQDNVEFAAMVTAIDDSLGRVQSTLDRLGLAENTIVVFYSDNGGMAAANLGNPARKIPPDLLDVAYSTSNLPLRGAKGWLYEGGSGFRSSCAGRARARPARSATSRSSAPTSTPRCWRWPACPPGPSNTSTARALPRRSEARTSSAERSTGTSPTTAITGCRAPAARSATAPTSCWSTSRTARCSSSTWRTTRASSATWLRSNPRRPLSCATGSTPGASPCRRRCR